MKKRGFIVYPTYKYQDEKAWIHLYGRLENGESFLALFERKLYFHIKKSDLEKAEKTIPGIFEEDSFTNFDGEEVVKVTIDNPRDVLEARKLLQNEGIICYEADISLPYRFLMDTNILGTVELDGQVFSSKEFASIHNKKYTVDHVFLEPTITSVDYFPVLKVLSFDIETDMLGEKLLSIAITMRNSSPKNHGKIYENVLILKEGLYNKAEAFTDEKKLLERFMEIVIELDPDVIAGWNVIDFDLSVLRNLFRKHSMDFCIGRDSSPIYLKQAESFYQDSIAKVEGRVIIDGIAALKQAFVKLPDFKLETAAQHFLGAGKLFSGNERHTDIQQAFEDDPQKLIEYNLLDTTLVLDIFDESNVLNLIITRSKLTGMQMDRVKASIAALDSLYLRKLRNNQIVAPTSFSGEREERIQGGYVRESLPGIYDNILVFDFKSLYPSIIRTFNIDPYAFVPEHSLLKLSDEEKSKFIVAPNGAHFKAEGGFLPEIIETLWDARDVAKQEQDDLKSLAIKITMNSFFGVLANPNCRFYSIEMGNAITHFGQYLIKKSATEAEKKQYTVVYGDTDSIFLDIHEKDYSKALEIGKKIEEEMNDFFVNFISSEYGLSSKMELEFEKTYKKFFMPRIRGSEGGAKKRYAGILEKKGEDVLDFVGLEFVRSDWTQIAKDFQQELLYKVFDGDEVVKYIRTFIANLRDGKYNEKLVYRKQIRKPVSSYTKTTPPHIQAARKIGRDSVGLIDYLMTVNGPEEKDHLEHDVDYEHYIEKQLRPIGDSVLQLLDESFDEIIQPEKQKSLFEF